MDKKAEAMIARGVRVLGPFLKQRGHGPDNHILVLRPEKIGDMVVTIPFLRNLRRAFPKDQITLVCSPVNYNLVELCPYVDEVLTYDKRADSHFFMTNLKRSWHFVKETLPKRNWRMAFIPSYACPDTYPEAWIAYLGGAKHRIGYSERCDALKHQTYMGMYDIYLNDPVVDRTVHHEVTSTLRLLEHLRLPVDDAHLELFTDQADEDKVDALWQQARIDADKLKILVSMSTSSAEKDWPVERFAEVCHSMQDNYNAEIILTGAGNAAKADAEKLQAMGVRVHDFVNQTTLRQTYLLMRKLDAYLGGDSGPLHLAAAAGLCGAAVYKDASSIVNSNTQWYAPWQADIEIVCPQHALAGCEGGCHAGKAHCITQVSSEQVMETLLKVLAQHQLV